MTQPTESSTPQRRRAVLRATLVSACVAMLVAWWIVIRPASEDRPLSADPPDRSIEDQATVGTPAPPVTFRGLDGPDIAVTDLVGKVVVINFWASTCAPCIKEMPLLEEVATDRDDVTFIGVSVTESAEAGSAMVKRTGVTFEQGRDPDGEQLAAFGGIALPHTVVIDAKGKVAALANRAIRDRSDLEALISKALP